MAEFDRMEQPSSAKETKKVVLVVALGALLVGLIVFEMIKKGPQEANAATPGALNQPAELSGMDESANTLRQALLHDPTASLLHAAAATQPDLTLRNPFRMAPDWMKILVTSGGTDTAVPTVPLKQPDPPRGVTMSVTPQAVRAEDYKLQTIVNQGAEGMTAMINNRFVKEGDVLGKARVLEIRNNGVTLQHVDFPNGPKTDVMMRTGMSSQP